MLQQPNNSSQLFSANIVFINELYQKYLQNPQAVDSSWAEFFAQNHDEIKSILADYNGPSWGKRNLKVIGSPDFDISSNSSKEIAKKDGKTTNLIASKDLEVRLKILIANYRRFGHLASNLDPLGLTSPQYVHEIDLKNNDIDSSDLEKELNLNGQKTKLSQLVANLNHIYCNSVGCEFEHIGDLKQKEWFANQVESIAFTELSKAEKHKVLQEIIRSERFEQFLHKRFPGAKRFSIEGGEASICAVEKIIQESARSGVKKIIIGMAHRGRLNTLTGVLGKPYHRLVAEFQGTPSIPENITKSGDVKYHMGYSSTRNIDGKNIDLSLAFNPSHLEAVNVVVAGRVRATQDLLGDASRTQALALLIHGDAAFAGQGSVAESLVMNGTAGYDTGGVIHIIINNQIGFTANPTDSRSTQYASDLAKSIDAPIFHVNGDDVEAVVKIAGLISQYRQIFKKDVVLDVVCYRKYGHNEGDEPLYTQPIMYSKIKDHPSLEKIYSQKLLNESTISQAEYDKMVADFEAHLNHEFNQASSYKALEPDWLKGEWQNIKDGDSSIPKTAVSDKILKDLIAKITSIPQGFNVNPKILRQLEAKKQVVEDGKDIDWGTAESLAFASLIAEGKAVRITGQDAGRGTFSHRHSILHDAKTGQRHNIFAPISHEAHFEVHDSVLSEYGVMGFEYGYSLSAPDILTIWEAQFGDFANGAQIIFDQFVASSEVKWLRKSGLVMLLPHGFEGQGPEHSSARLERYLQACADNNLRVVNITNPANFFHALRRQIRGQDRKPLVVMSPKSLLRHKLAVSNLSEFTQENFKTIIPESQKLVSDDKIKKVVLCSGKVYYDLFEAREAKKINDIALIRLEQLYPFPSQELGLELKKYKNAEIIWCQEEPKNMGAWKFVDDLIEEILITIKHKNSRPKYVGRIACASPATGYGSYHAREQKVLIDQALS
ncbi:MAG: 2-oxoglutarate dehydrogenase E1 component [Alphaproteobacteria bacterium]|nr:2-oxoglutarate dehydrogenase E1 component [Alphaproteobacteria bacterium]